MPPINDNFSAATVLDPAGGTLAGTTVAATSEVDEPVWDGMGGVLLRNSGDFTFQSVWYKLTAPADGAWEVDEGATAAGLDIVVYRGTTLADLEMIANNANTNIRFAVFSGQTVYVQIYSYVGGTPHGESVAGAQPFNLSWFPTPCLRLETKVDGTHYGRFLYGGRFPSGGALPADHIRDLWFGSLFSGTPVDRQFRNIKVGTTGYGSSDIFAPALASTAEFDSIQGSSGDLTVSGGVLSIANSGDDVFAVKDLGADITYPLYVQFEFKISAGEAADYTPEMHAVAFGDPADFEDDWIDSVYAFSGSGWGLDGGMAEDGAMSYGSDPAADTWITLDFRWDYGGATPTPPADWEYLLTDIATADTLLDLTTYAILKIQPRFPGRPTQVTLTLASDTPGLLVAAVDGDPNLCKGKRSLLIKRKGRLLANAKIFNLQWAADENTATVTIVASTPLRQLLSRNCFSSDGRLADFGFESPTTGAEMLQQVIENSVTYEDNTITLGGTDYDPAPLPIDYTTGDWSGSVELWAQFTDTPVTIGDLIAILTSSGKLEIVEEPVEGVPGILSRLNAVDHWGTDKSATVHFDLGTGAYNVAKGRRSDSIDELCNRLIYELGPKKGKDRWKSNITGTETGAAPGSEDLTAYQLQQLLSREKYGTFAQVRIYASNDESTSGRPLFHELWKTESTFRVNGRDLIFLTPTTTNDDTPFEPYDDYEPGDTVAGNAAEPLLGPAIVDAAQRVYGFDLDVDANKVETVSELIVSSTGV